MTGTRLLAALLLAGLGLAVPAAAEMYKCKGPDGKTLYTSDKSQCPGSEAHTLKGQVQSAGESRAPRRPTPASRSAASGADDDARAAAWRQKKASAEERLASLQRDLPNMYKVVGWCNRGGELFVEEESGVRKGYSCDRAEQEYEQAVAEKERLEAFLGGGIEEECRRAGCLPGWIR